MEPIHRAAYDGNEGEVSRLVQEDGWPLDSQIQGDVRVDAWPVKGCTPLMLAAWKGHDAVVGRLIELGVDVGLSDAGGQKAAHWACKGQSASALGLLLDAGASFNVRNDIGSTPLMCAAIWGATDCVEVLLARDGDALVLDAQDSYRWTALHWAARQEYSEIVQLLLLAGADPSIRNHEGHTPIDFPRSLNYQPCTALLQAALAEPQRPRLLLKARALLDAARIRDVVGV
jgi:ankyrin repeat protein